MNIFVTDPSPTVSAQVLPDKHIVKMPLESCQMLAIVCSEKWGHGYGEIHKKDGDDIEVQIAGTFAKDKFIVLKNVTKNPFENAQPHPYFDYEKKVFTKDGREEYMKEQEELKK